MKIMLAFFEQFVEMSGGIERVLCNMANAMIKRGHDVSIVYAFGRKGKIFYPLDSKAKLYNLMEIHPEKWKAEAFGKGFGLVDRLVRESIRLFSKSGASEYNENVKGRQICPEVQETVQKINPDIIISFRYETSNYLLNFAHVKTPVITMFHLDPDEAMGHAPRGEKTAVEESVCAQVLLKSDIPKVKKYCPRAKVLWIPNAVPQYEEEARPGEEKKTYEIINTARLNKNQKQQHLLIEAFHLLAKDFPQWKVRLWGGGDKTQYPYAEELKKLIARYQLQGQVFLMGETSDVLKEYLKSDIFCFPSAFEGFPLAMTEAMSAGLPVVGFRSCDAVNDLVENGKTGLLADDGAEGLAEALRSLMENREMRAHMGREAKKAMKQFAPESVWDTWEDLMNRVLKEAGKT